MEPNWKRVLRVSSNSHQGERKYMEDKYTVEKTQNTAFLGVFDGHGGEEAAAYAQKYLYENIKAQPDFFEDDSEKIRNAIREGFLQTHSEMARVVDDWRHSTSGTTATIVIFRGDKLYVAHVGDSSAVLALKGSEGLEGKKLTRDHDPGDIEEKGRIESLGGKVVLSKGVHRVAWERLSQNYKYESIPFLAVSRALGDIWSYNHKTRQYIVSPEPEIKVIDYDPEVHKFLIIASDGLWKVINAQEAVEIVSEYEEKESTFVKRSAHHLLTKSLDMWRKSRWSADNISIIVAFIDEFGAPSDSTLDSDADTIPVSSSEEDPPIIKNSGCKRKIDENLCASNKKKSKICKM